MQEEFSNLQGTEAAKWRWNFDISQRYARDDIRTPLLMGDSDSRSAVMHCEHHHQAVLRFSTNKFALLLVSICDDEKARAAISNAAILELSRAQFDAGINRHSFWTTVEHGFNKGDAITTADVSADVDHTE